MRFADLEGLDVALLGAGREGRSVWRQFRRRFPRQALTVYSETTVESIAGGAFSRPGDSLLIGPFAAADIARHDVLVRSPGVSPYRPELAAAARAGVRFTTATNLWFAEHPRARTICITGTKGKSTTSALTAHLLGEAGCRVRLAGNIGRPLLDCAGRDVDWWVIELSSYQLADCTGQPTIGVILNLADAHLEWHGGRRAYRRDKLRMADLAGDMLVLNHEDATLRRKFAGRDGVTWFGDGEGYRVSEGALLSRDGTRLPEPPGALPGRHNLLNLCAALTVVELAGVSIPDLRPALASFEGLPHRLQWLGERNGLEFYDDSMATTPLATLAALEALAGKAVTLIIGGQRQAVDWSEAMARMRASGLHALITLPDSGPELAQLACEAGLETGAGVFEAAGLEDAVRLAMEVSAVPGTVLLSPGAPSFPRFRDFADRGEQFTILAGLGGRG